MWLCRYCRFFSLRLSISHTLKTSKSLRDPLVLALCQHIFFWNLKLIFFFEIIFFSKFPILIFKRKWISQFSTNFSNKKFFFLKKHRNSRISKTKPPIFQCPNPLKTNPVFYISPQKKFSKTEKKLAKKQRKKQEKKSFDCPKMLFLSLFLLFFRVLTQTKTRRFLYIFLRKRGLKSR